MDEPWRRILTAPRAEELDQRCPVRGPHMEHAGAAVAEVELEQEHTGELHAALPQRTTLAAHV